MTNSRYPRFHKYVTRIYIALGLTIITVLLSSSFVDDDISISEVAIIAAFLLFVYIVYWAIVRLNCYGTPNSQQRRRDGDSNQGTVYSQGNRSSTSMRSSLSPHGTYQTFANYRFGAFSNRLRRFSSFASQRHNNNNGEEESRNDNDTTDYQYIRDTEQILTTPPPTYTKTLQDAGFPPPYISKTNSLDDRIMHVEHENNRNVRPRSELLTQSRSTSFRTFTSSSSLEGASGGGRESGIQVPLQSYRPDSNSHHQADENVVAVDMNHSPIIAPSLHDNVLSSPIIPLPIPPIPISSDSELRQISSIPEQSENENEMQTTHPLQPLSRISTDTSHNSGSSPSSVIINIVNNCSPTHPAPPIPYSQTTSNVSTASLSTPHISASIISEQNALQRNSTS